MSSHFRQQSGIRRQELSCRYSLGLFDVCPERDGRGWRDDACGQTLNKPRRRKPRNAAVRFVRSEAYGE
jgi:hypothetical protein